MRSKVGFYSLSAIATGAVVAVVLISQPGFTWWTPLDLVVVLTVGPLMGSVLKLAVSTAVARMTGLRLGWVNLPIGPASKIFQLGTASVRLRWNAGWTAGWQGTAGPRGTLANAAAGPVAAVLVSPLLVLLPVRQPIAVGLAVAIGLGGLTMLIPHRDPITGLWSPGARLFVPRLRSLTMFFGSPDWPVRPDTVDRLLTAYRLGLSDATERIPYLAQRLLGLFAEDPIRVADPSLPEQIEAVSQLTLIILSLPGLPPEALDRAARHAEWLSHQPDSRVPGTRLPLAYVRLWQGHADQTVTLCQAELSRPDLPDSSRATALTLLHRAENQRAEDDRAR